MLHAKGFPRKAVILIGSEVDIKQSMTTYIANSLPSVKC